MSVFSDGSNRAEDRQIFLKDDSVQEPMAVRGKDDERRVAAGRGGKNLISSLETGNE